MERPLRILIVEPSAIVVEGLLSILGKRPEFKCLHPLYSVDSLCDYVRKEKPDLLVLNPTLAFDAKEVLALGLPLVALVYQYVEKDRLGFFNAVLDVRERSERIPAVLQQAWSSAPRPEEASDESHELSDREIDVLKYVAQGLMNKEIADKLNISIHTVISHRKNISRKTGIKSVAGLTVYAIMKGYIASA